MNVPMPPAQPPRQSLGQTSSVILPSEPAEAQMQASQPAAMTSPDHLSLVSQINVEDEIMDSDMSSVPLEESNGLEGFDEAPSSPEEHRHTDDLVPLHATHRQTRVSAPNGVWLQTVVCWEGESCPNKDTLLPNWSCDHAGNAAFHCNCFFTDPTCKMIYCSKCYHQREAEKRVRGRSRRAPGRYQF